MARPWARAPSLRRYAILQADLASIAGLSADDTVDLGGYGSRMDGGEGELLAVDSAGLTADEGELFASGTAGIMLRRQRAVATTINAREFGILPSMSGQTQMDRLRTFLASLCSPSQAVTLNIPFAHYPCVFDGRGIRNLVCNGGGGWFTGLRAHGGGIPNYSHTREGSGGDNLPFLIGLPSIGATVLTAADGDSRADTEIGRIVTRLSGSQECHVLIYSGDKQDGFGYPPNYRNHEYHLVTAADVGAGTVTLAGDGIRYQHTLRGLPVRCFLIEEEDGTTTQGNSYPVWLEQTHNFLNIRCTSGNFINIGGGVQVFNDCTLNQAVGDYAWYTAGQSFEMNRCLFQGSNWEPDKAIETVECNDCAHENIRIFGSGITNWTDTGGTATKSWAFFGPVHYRRVNVASTEAATNVSGNLGFNSNYIWQDALYTGGSWDDHPRNLAIANAHAITDFDFTDNEDDTGVISLPAGRFLDDKGNGIENIINVGSIFSSPKLGYRLTATDVATADNDTPRLAIPVTIARLATGASAAYGIPDYASRDPDQNDWLLMSRVGYADIDGVEYLGLAGPGDNGGTVTDPTIVSRGWVYNPHWRRTSATSFQVTLWPGDSNKNIELWPIIDAVVTSVSVTVTGAVGNVASDQIEVRLATNAINPNVSYPGKGTITAAGSTTVTGTGTLFSRFRAGDILVLDGDSSEHTVASVASETSLTLNASATFTGESFTVIDATANRAGTQTGVNSLLSTAFRQLTTLGTIDTGANGTTTYSDVNTYAMFLELGKFGHTVDGKMVVTVNLAAWGAIPE